jgi:hypothetical protein
MIVILMHIRETTGGCRVGGIVPEIFLKLDTILYGHTSEDNSKQCSVISL